MTLSGDDIKVKMEENEDPLMCDSCRILLLERRRFNLC